MVIRKIVRLVLHIMIDRDIWRRKSLTNYLHFYSLSRDLPKETSPLSLYHDNQQDAVSQSRSSQALLFTKLIRRSHVHARTSCE